jgi:hypothetical protein
MDYRKKLRSQKLNLVIRTPSGRISWPPAKKLNLGMRKFQISVDKVSQLLQIEIKFGRRFRLKPKYKHIELLFR